MHDALTLTIALAVLLGALVGAIAGIALHHAEWKAWRAGRTAAPSVAYSTGVVALAASGLLLIVWAVWLI